MNTQAPMRDKYLGTSFESALVRVDVMLGGDSLTTINVVFREILDSVQEEGRVPLHEVD